MHKLVTASECATMDFIILPEFISQKRIIRS